MDKLGDLKRKLERKFGGVKYFETERSSIYTFLPEGTYQRYKTAERSLREPHDVTVFIPDYETVKRACPKEINFEKVFGKDKEEYDSKILNLVHSGYHIHLIDQKGKILESPKAISESEGQLYLAFEHKGKVDLYVPVSTAPKIGWSTYQATKKVVDGHRETRTHLGHKVTRIAYESGKVES